MTTFDDRENAFEAKFAHDSEMQFRAEAATSFPSMRLHHLRVESGRHEVDLVLELGNGKVFGIEFKAGAAPTLADARPGELARSSLDASRAGMQLGWKPWTDMAAGSAAVLDYFRTKQS